MESASAFIDNRIKELGDWRGKMLAKVRNIIHAADPEIVEEWKWAKASSPGTPVWSHGGIVCTGETYKSVVKMTFAKGAALKDPKGLFNSSLEGNVRRAIDIQEGDKIDEVALKISSALPWRSMSRAKRRLRRNQRDPERFEIPTQAKKGLNGALAHTSAAGSNRTVEPREATSDPLQRWISELDPHQLAPASRVPRHC
jgi:hypothetical protein